MESGGREPREKGIANIMIPREGTKWEELSGNSGGQVDTLELGLWG